LPVLGARRSARNPVNHCPVETWRPHEAALAVHKYKPEGAAVAYETLDPGC
jgi:hypothetical protein